jgi:NADPH:quinone reductase-like Zn-dependent oxidoreductase
VDGTFAEYIAIDVNNVYLKPTHLSEAEAAALPLAGVTAYRACFYQANVQKGQTVLITGIGR